MKEKPILRILVHALAELRRRRRRPVSTLCRKLLLASMLSLLPLAPALAGEAPSGAVEGRLMDVENDRPLAGATVRIFGPPLARERTTVTGDNGRFRFPLLPPGTYQLSAQRDGWVAVEQSDIRVRLGHTVTLDYEMFEAFDDDEVMITTSAPVLDLTRAISGALLDRDLFARLPVERTFALLPRLTAGVGPAPGPGGLGIAGGGPGDNRSLLDGLDGTGPASGRPVIALPPEMVEQIRVATGGLPAEIAGAAGGVVVAVTRSGGGELHGHAVAFYQGEELAATPEPTAHGGEEAATAWDVGVAVGGPLGEGAVRGFLALDSAYASQRRFHRGGRAIEQERREVFSAGRLSFQPSAGSLFSAGFFANPGEVEREPLLEAAGELADSGDSGGWGAAANGNVVLSRRVFLEAGGGRLEERREVRPLADVALYEDLTPGARWAGQAGCGEPGSPGAGASFAADCLGGTLVRAGSEARRSSARAAVGLFSEGRRAGSELRLGGEWKGAEVLDARRSPGPAPGPFVDAAGVVVDAGGLTGQHWILRSEEVRLVELEGAAARRVRQLALFAEETLRLGADVVLRLGVRTESLTARLGRDPGAGAPVLDLGLTDTVAPRLAVIWDIRGTGQSKLYAYAGRFRDLPPEIVEGETFGSRRRRVSVFAAPADGSLPTAADPGVLERSLILGDRLGIDPDLAAPSVTEVRIGYERELLPELTVRVGAVHRELDRVLEDVSPDGGRTYLLTNPGRRITVDPRTGLPLPAPVAFPRPRRDYDALELALDKDFAGGWQLHGSWLYAETEGNFAAPPEAEERLLAPAVDTRFDLAELLPAGDGPLPEDRRHQVRIYGSYRLSGGWTVGAYGRYLSGAPVSRYGAHPELGRRQRPIGSPGDAGRTPPLWSLDLHLERPFDLGGVTLELVGDVFNLTDRREAVRVEEEWTFAARPVTVDPAEPRTNPSFGRPLEVQPPRSLRLGVRFLW